MSGAADVVIVGGGVIGCAIGYQLSKAGAVVTIVDRRRIAEEASWASAGIVSPPRPTASSYALAQLAMRSFEAYPPLLTELREASGVSAEEVQSGELALALDDDEAMELQESIPAQQDLGLPVEWVDAAELARREPALGPAFVGATYYPSVLSLRAERLTTALARASQLRGATILEYCPVDGFLTDGDRVTGVRTRLGNLSAGDTVIAAGAWTADLGATLGVTLPTRPVPGQMLALANPEPPLRHILAGAGGYLIPRADGTVAVGATIDPEGSYDPRVTPAGLAWLIDLIRTIAPALLRGRIVQTWAGLRPGSADDRPLIGRVARYEHLWVAAGHFRNGILWAPITAELLAASILAGRPDPALAPCDPARF